MALSRADVAGHIDEVMRQNPDTPYWQLRIEDFEPTQGTGYSRRFFEQYFEMCTTPMAYTVDDFAKIVAPTLILVGDRDQYCSVEEGVSVYRTRQQGEFGFIPGMKPTFRSFMRQLYRVLHRMVPARRPPACGVAPDRRYRGAAAQWGG
jgi:hypothetical protein